MAQPNHPASSQTDYRAIEGSRQLAADALVVSLARRVNDFVEPFAIEQFKSGLSNPTAKLVTPAHSDVMRAKPVPDAKLLHPHVRSSASTR